MRRGELWEFTHERPGREDDPRTPYRVIVSADYCLDEERRWVLTAPVVASNPGGKAEMVAVPLGKHDPVAGWVRVDKITDTFRDWLKGPLGQLSPASLERLTVALRTELDL